MACAHDEQGLHQHDGAADPPFVAPRAPLPAGAPNYVTPRGTRLAALGTEFIGSIALIDPVGGERRRGAGGAGGSSDPHSGAEGSPVQRRARRPLGAPVFRRGEVRSACDGARRLVATAPDRHRRRRRSRRDQRTDRVRGAPRPRPARQEPGRRGHLSHASRSRGTRGCFGDVRRARRGRAEGPESNRHGVLHFSSSRALTRAPRRSRIRRSVDPRLILKARSHWTAPSVAPWS